MSAEVEGVAAVRGLIVGFASLAVLGAVVLIVVTPVTNGLTLLVAPALGGLGVGVLWRAWQGGPR